MKRRTYLASFLTLLIGGGVVVFGATTFFGSNYVFADLSYRSTEKVEFNINPTVSITINGGDLSIPSLAPGDSKDSNIITVTASSNAMNGYSLSSTVGDSTNASTELRKGGTDTTYKFTNLATNKPSLSDFDSNSNTWGYSYCNNANDCSSTTNWISGDITGTPTTGYNGLPLYTTESPITLIESSTAATNSIQFKIGARSTTTLVAGEYTNIINFIGVANPNPPIVYMQNATLADCGKDMVDNRDNTIYTTALLENGQCWMTKNLDLAGGTQLTSDDTNMASDWVMPTANGFQINNRLPNSETIVSGTSLPETAFSDNTKAYVFNSNSTTCTSSSPCYSYYSWTTATLGSGLSISARYVDAPYDICPKGWHLPNIRNGTNDVASFNELIIALGGSASIATYDSTTSPTGTAIFNGLSSDPLYFLRTGDYSSGLFSFNGGRYWSSTSNNSTSAFNLRFTSGFVSYDYSGSRQDGDSIRCVHD